MRKLKFSLSEFYHLYNRGVDRRVIFENAQDYKRFLVYLRLLNDEGSVRVNNIFTSDKSVAEIYNIEQKSPLVAIGAYCLMPNHFHLLVTPLVEGGLSRFMQRLQTAHTMYFNQKYERTGSLFQGTFKAEHVDDDVYMRYLYAYIHLNPAKLKDPLWKERKSRDFQKMEDFILTYPYSSVGEYVNRKHTITNPKLFPEYFSSEFDFSQELIFWLNYPLSKKDDSRDLGAPSKA